MVVGARGRVPGTRTELIGRDALVATVLSDLGRRRLVTLAGPAGVGKTRVAIGVAQAATELFPDGVLWVDLAELAGAEVDAALAAAASLRESATDDPTRQLIEALDGSRTLLVLDNCEHSLDEVATVADELLHACSDLAVLCTSTESLAIDGELVCAVTPLDVPDADLRDAVQIAEYPALRLFAARATAAQPEIDLTGEHAAIAARVCRRLDGMPLGIELAAARLRVLTLAQLADALDDVFAVLVGAGRLVPARHHSLRAALDWSYALLLDAERRAVRHLSVFAASFTLDAAAAVCAQPPATMLDLLARLVDKSFVIAIHDGPVARYRMLGIVRLYAAAELSAAGEAEAARDAHLHHVVTLTRELDAALGIPGEEVALNRLEEEIPDIDAAIRHVVAGAPVVAGLELGAAVSRMCYLRGHYRQGRTWLEGLARWGAALSDHAPARAARAAVLYGAGRLAFLECDYLPATRALDEAVDLYRAEGDVRGCAAALQSLAGIAREQCRYERAHELCTESRDLCRSAEDAPGAARAGNQLALLAWLQNDLDRAEQLASEALVEFAATGDHEGVIWAHLSLGCTGLYGPDPAIAAAPFERAAELSRDLAFREGAAWADHLRGLLELRMRRPERARPLLLRALEADRALGDRWRVASLCADLAATCLPGSPRTAALLLGRADALWQELGSGPAPCERPTQAITRAHVLEALGDDVYVRCWQEGHASPHAPAPPVLLDPSKPTPSAVAPAGSPTATAAASASAALEIAALGQARVLVDERELVAADWRYAKPRELFFLLACSGRLTKAQIGLALWPDLDETQLRNALHTGLRDLRKALGDTHWVLFTGGHYALATERRIAFDVTTFEQHLAAARATPERHASLEHLTAAVDGYGGDLLPDHNGEWVRTRREDLRQRYLDALIAGGRLLASDERHAEAAVMFERATRAEPLLEIASRSLMVAWARAGQPGRAVRHYRDLEQRLRDELAVAPAAETRRIYQRLTGAVKVEH